MPDIPFAGDVIREMKARPYTMIVIIALSVAVTILWRTTARADDVADLKQQVAVIDSSIKVAALESQVRSISTELFGLKQQVIEKQEAHEHVDQLYLERIASLESDKAQAERELTALRSGP